MDLREHTSQDFEAELALVREKLLAMGGHVDEVLEASGRALLGRDLELANQIIAGDNETDAMELEIDHLCLEILARRQPVAGDLRLLTAALKMVIDLERIGDLGVSIAARVVDLDYEPPIMPYDDLLSMLALTREMLSEVLAALLTGDAPRAASVIDKDQVVDAYAARIFDEVIRRTRENAGDLARATRVQAISRYVERIGDHVTNIAERVVFIVTGEDVRHAVRLPRAALS
jgi:phosphate transport system protein